MRRCMLLVLGLFFGLNLFTGARVGASELCETLWGPAGLQLSQMIDDRYVEPINPYMIADGAGGAYYAWRERRDEHSGTHVYLQRIDASGMVKWDVNGIDVIDPDFYSIQDGLISMARDGSGGVIVSWYNAENEVINMQRLDADGIEQWTHGGVIANYAASWFSEAPY